MKNENTKNMLDKFVNLCKEKIKWFQRKMKWLLSLAGIGVIFTGIQAIASIKSCSEPIPDPIEVISELKNTLKPILIDAEKLKPMEIPDSLLKKQEVKCIKKFQGKFEIYRQYIDDYVSSYNENKRVKYNSQEELIRAYQISLLYYEDLRRIEEDLLDVMVASFIGSVSVDSLTYSSVSLRLLTEKLNYSVAAKKDFENVYGETIDILNDIKNKKRKKITRRDVKRIVKQMDILQIAVSKLVDADYEVISAFYKKSNQRLKQIILDRNE